MENKYDIGNYTSEYASLPNFNYAERGKAKRNLAVKLILLPVVLFAALGVITFSKPETKDRIRSEPASSKVYYRRVVRYVDFEDLVISYHGLDNGADVLSRSLALGPKRRLLGLTDSASENRYRRDITRMKQYGELYRRHRASNSDAIEILRRNEINPDDLADLETNSRHPDSTGTHEATTAETTSEEPEHLSEMERTYRKFLHQCEAEIMRPQSNDSDHNETAHSRDAHKEECAREVASRVPALWVLLYSAIILFLFIGLAIICDDFFVASLEAISERLNLSEDVAGATFMAAGSSAPELFISVAGAGAGSDVGVGTIVGSAVFNLLIIIALTAALAGKILCLDWRPFVRDSIFYALSIIAFIMFSLDTQFQFWESLILLALYVLYIVTMKFNPQLMDFMAKWSCCSCFETRVTPQDEEKQAESDPPTTNGKIPPSPVASPVKPVSRASVSPETVPKIVEPSNILAPPTPEPPTVKLDKVEQKNANDSGICVCGNSPKPVTCSCCVIHVTSQPCASCVSRCLCSSPTMVRSSLQCASCSSIAKEEINVISRNAPMKQNGCEAPRPEVVPTGNGFLPNSIVSHDTMESLETSRENGGNETTKDNMFPMSVQNLNNSNKCTCSGSSKSKPDSSEVAVLEISYDEPQGEIDNSGPAQGEKQEAADEAEEEMIKLLPCLPAIKNPAPSKPSSSKCIPGSKYVASYVIFILSFPWVCAFTWTVPNCAKPSTRKWYLASFFLCIAWIALLSFIMIELVEKIGCLLSIDAYTMGLVIVAVGTSVPDAISSVLVAKEGYGDMAVSNALGSNVFDINLGLGLPFFLSSIITAKPVSLLSPVQMCLFENLPLPIRMVPHVKFGFILLLILIIAVLVFMFVRFRLNRQVTLLFVGMYITFLVYAFVQEKTCHAFFC